MVIIIVIMFVIINRKKERREPGKYKFINSTFTLEGYWEMTRNYRLTRYQSLIQDMHIKTQSFVNFATINTKHGCFNLAHS
jgi:hypothetical protein